MAKKAKSDKSCGLDPACHINKAVDSIKKSIGAGASGRKKRIDDAVGRADRGEKKKGSSTLANP